MARSVARPAELDRIGDPGKVAPRIAPDPADRHRVEPVMTSDEPSPRPVHRSVLLDEIVHWLAPREGMTIVDGTAGAGGHAAALAARVGPAGRVIGLDRDPEMLRLAEAATRGLPVTPVKAPYSDLGRVLGDLGIDRIDGL